MIMKKPGNPNSYYLDRSIVLFFFLVILISSSVFSYRYSNYIPCEIADFEIISKNYEVGDLIKFKDKTKNVSKRAWDFGDGSNPKSENSLFHKFEKPGRYTITLKVNNTCEIKKAIIIKAVKPSIDSSKIARFTIPEQIRVGEPLTLKDESKNATKWEWWIEDDGKTKKFYDARHEYTFKTPGDKRITLIINDADEYATQKTIMVLKKEIVSPPPFRKPPEKEKKNPPVDIKVKPDSTSGIDISVKKVDYISEKDFGDRLTNLARGQIKEEDVNNALTQFLCGNLDLPITARKKSTTFSEFFEEIKGRKIKIKKLKIVRNKETNCIEYLDIDYRKLIL